MQFTSYKATFINTEENYNNNVDDDDEGNFLQFLE